MFFVLLALVVPASTLHAGLFHAERHHECGNPHDATGPTACDGEPDAHHDDSCALCLASKRFVTIDISCERARAAPIEVHPDAVPVDVHVELFPFGASGPRAPPLRD